MDAFMIDDDGRRIVLRGYAAAFNVCDVGRRFSVPEIILPTAFDETLSLHGGNISMIWEHGGEQMQVPGDLQVWRDRTGLAFEMKNIFATPRSSAVVREICSRRVMGMSFGFHKADHRLMQHGGRQVYAMTRCRGLSDISPTGDPSFPATRVWALHQEQWVAPADLRAAWLEGLAWRSAASVQRVPASRAEAAANFEPRRISRQAHRPISAAARRGARSPFLGPSKRSGLLEGEAELEMFAGASKYLPEHGLVIRSERER